MLRTALADGFLLAVVGASIAFPVVSSAQPLPADSPSPAREVLVPDREAAAPSVGASPAERSRLAADLGVDSLRKRHVHREVRVTMGGKGARRFFVFEPGDPRPPRAPVVLFHHGWSGMNPLNYGSWIDHLVRQGCIVVFPVYQKDARTMPREVTRFAIDADRQALRMLQSGDHVRPDLRRVVAVGYSMGATISANIAAHARDEHLPPIRAMLLANPGNAKHVAKGDEAKSILGDLSSTPADTKVVLVAGDEDKLVKDGTALEILRGLCHLPRSQKDLLIFHSDRHDAWGVTAGHGAPGAPDSRYDFGDDGAKVVDRIGRGEWPAMSKSMNNLDIYGYWKLLDGLLDSVIRDASPDAALGGGPRQRFMGLWPDGQPLKEATVAADPCTPAAP